MNIVCLYLLFGPPVYQKKLFSTQDVNDVYVSIWIITFSSFHRFMCVLERWNKEIPFFIPNSRGYSRDGNLRWCSKKILDFYKVKIGAPITGCPYRHCDLRSCLAGTPPVCAAWSPSSSEMWPNSSLCATIMARASTVTRGFPMLTLEEEFAAVALPPITEQ